MSRNWKTGLALSLVAAAGAGLYFYYKKQVGLLMQYTIKLAGFNILAVSKDLVRLRITLRFFNASNLECEIQHVYGDVYLKGQNVGFFEDVNAFVIPMKGESDVPIEFAFSPVRILKNAAEFALELGITKDMPIEVKGYATVKTAFLKATLPFSYQTTLKAYLA